MSKALSKMYQSQLKPGFDTPLMGNSPYPERAQAIQGARVVTSMSLYGSG
ncbi:MAG: hypothetical protein OIF51_05805 [Cellvibrionaceae bacterium]|nr:hypothetical protein [Cellvibrionaceae bacterium]